MTKSEAREYAKVRAENKCYRCFVTNDNNRVMHIHHLDRNIKNNSKGNLLYLCSSCHRIIHRSNTFKIFIDSVNIAKKTGIFANDIKEEKIAKEKNLIADTLMRTNGNKVKAASLLGISRQNLQYKIKSLYL